jgi:hypothetical protein
MMMTLPILADVITADMGFFPGCALVGPAFGLPLSVLAAVLERPFHTRAGIKRWTVWYSLQANFASLLVGYILIFVTIPAVYAIGFFWFPVAVSISILIERKYLMWRARSAGFDCRWQWVSWANVLSAFALVGVLMLSAPFETPAIKHSLVPYRFALTIAGIGISFVAFGIAFAVPFFGARHQSVAGNLTTADAMRSCSAGE